MNNIFDKQDDKLLELAYKALEPYKKKLDENGSLDKQKFSNFLKVADLIMSIRNFQVKQRQAYIKEMDKITPEQFQYIIKNITDVISKIPEVSNVFKKHWGKIEKRLEEMQEQNS